MGELENVPLASCLYAGGFVAAGLSAQSGCSFDGFGGDDDTNVACDISYPATHDGKFSDGVGVLPSRASAATSETATKAA